MAGRFSARRVGPDLPPVEPEPIAPPAAAETEPPVDAVAWTIFPEALPEPAPIVPMRLAPEPVPAAAGTPATPNPLLTDKLLDAKVRLHRKLIEEINLSALEKLPEDEIRKHVQQLVSQYILVERLALNAEELAGFFTDSPDAKNGPP